MSYSSLRPERSTKLYNETALFRTCAHSSLIRLQQASVGSKVEPFNIDSKRTGDSFLSTKSRRVQNNKTVLDKPEATPNVVEEEFMSCPKSQECILPPSAPQVEKNVLKTSSSLVKSAASTEKPRTRSAARVVRHLGAEMC